MAPSDWLKARVAGKARDQETLALLGERARKGKGYAELAVERGETVSALHNRVHKFKEKYLAELEQYREDERRKEARRRTFLVVLITLGAVLAAAGAVLLLLFLLQAPPFAPSPRPASSTSGTPVLTLPPPSPDDVGHGRPR